VYLILFVSRAVRPENIREAYGHLLRDREGRWGSAGMRTTPAVLLFQIQETIVTVDCSLQSAREARIVFMGLKDRYVNRSGLMTSGALTYRTCADNMRNKRESSSCKFMIFGISV